MNVPHCLLTVQQKLWLADTGSEPWSFFELVTGQACIGSNNSVLVSQGSIKLDTPAQHAQQPLPEPSFESLYCQESSLTLTSTSDEEAIGTQPDSSGLSRQPTAHEIQYMDELDLTDNLGSLLGPGDSWIVPEDAHVAALPERMGTSVGCANGLTACISTTAQVLNDKPFQELFPMSA